MSNYFFECDNGVLISGVKLNGTTFRILTELITNSNNKALRIDYPDKSPTLVKLSHGQVPTLGISCLDKADKISKSIIGWLRAGGVIVCSSLFNELN